MLVTRDDVLSVRKISKQADSSMMNQFIEEAEFMDLKPLLGELYFAVKNAPTEDKYIKLLEPQTWGDKNHYHYGLKNVLSIFSYARYVLRGSFINTGFGSVVKTHQDSKPTEFIHKKAMYKEERAIAFSYFQSVVSYIEDNITDYPEWNTCEKRKTIGFTIKKVTL